MVLTIGVWQILLAQSNSNPAAGSHTAAGQADRDGHPRQYDQDEGEHVGGLVAVVVFIVPIRCEVGQCVVGHMMVKVDWGPITKHPDVSSDEPTEAGQAINPLYIEEKTLSSLQFHFHVRRTGPDSASPKAGDKGYQAHSSSHLKWKIGCMGFTQEKDMILTHPEATLVSYVPTDSRRGQPPHSR